jgi:putative component of membrane protein insertase Oxa1/YidC/SpoIIIJ protein YidD
MSTHTLKLEKDKVYTLRIDEIKENVKCFNTKEGQKCRHDITCSDKHGNSGIFEYCTFTPTADGFNQGAWQLVKCKFASDKGIEVTTVDDAPPQRQEVPYTDTKPEAQNSVNAYSVSLHGKSITFATAYAKDILCAEIATRPPGTVVTEEDIQGMLANAELINNWMTERVKF